MSTNFQRATRSRKAAVAMIGALVAAAIGPAAAVSAIDADPDFDYSGSRVLVSPYWLDNFNTANSHWLEQFLEPMGIEVDIIDPQADASRQLDIIQTAATSQNYDVVIWQPVEPASAEILSKQLTDAGIGHVQWFPQGHASEDVPFVELTGNLDDQSRPMGVAAGEYLKAHPDLGAPTIAFINSEPPNPLCDDRRDGLVEGIQSVWPEDEVTFAYDEGAVDAADATDNMTDFITRDIPFNVFLGCGGSVAIGGMAAINAAGLGGANGSKEPEFLYATTIDASPPELEFLWDQDNAVMRSSFYGAKSVAELMSDYALRLIDGRIGIDEPVVDASVRTTILTPDCETSRAAILDQFEGVEGFSVPECSFEYSGDTNTYIEINDTVER